MEFHIGELFPRVGFIVTNLSLPSRAIVRFYNKRGTAEQWIKEGKQATHWTRLSCHRFRANEALLQLSLLAYNLGNLWRRLVLPKRIQARPILLGGACGEPPHAASGGSGRYRCHLVSNSDCCYKIWSRKRKLGRVAERSISWEQTGRVRRAKK